MYNANKKLIEISSFYIFFLYIYYFLRKEYFYTLEQVFNLDSKRNLICFCSRIYFQFFVWIFFMIKHNTLISNLNATI